MADVYLEGTDQHRGWFHSSMLQACGTIGRAPYRGVVTHGFTMDEKGMKMSKSLGNTIGPDEIVKQYGADILRLWVASTDYTADHRIGPEILKGVSDSYRRLRNTFRFMLGALGEDQPAPVALTELPELEAYILHRLHALDAKTREAYSQYRFSELLGDLFQFCTVDLSAFYFDIRKDALYCDAKDSTERRAALWVISQVYERLTTWLAPILCFTMEEVWLERHKAPEASVHLEDFFATPSDWHREGFDDYWGKIRRARRVVTGAIEIQRQEKVIGSSLEAAPVVYVEDKDLAELLRKIDFAEICITSQIEISTDPAPEEAFRVAELPGIAVMFEKAQGEKCQRSDLRTRFTKKRVATNSKENITNVNIIKEIRRKKQILCETRA